MVVVVTFVDSADQMYRKLQITSPGGEFRVFELDYQASGSDIFIPTEDRTKKSTAPAFCRYTSFAMILRKTTIGRFGQVLFRYRWGLFNS